MESLSGWTSLPNLHPLLVHFPVALLPAALLLDAIGLARRRDDGMDGAAALLYVLAALGTGAAYLAGESAADGLVDVPARAELALSAHSDAALLALRAVLVAVALRVSLAVLGRTRTASAALLRTGRGICLLLVLAATGLVWRAADRGGALVYRHGLAVAAEGGPARGGEEAAGAGASAGEDGPAETGTGGPLADASTVAAGAPQDRMRHGEDGSLAWTPLPGDGTALTEILRVVGPMGEAAVSWQPPSDGAGGADGLALQVQGRALLLLPGTFGDVQMEATLVADGFQGTLGLAHHLREDGRGGGRFTVTTGGEAALLAGEGSSARTLDAKPAALPAGKVRLGVSSAGRHLKGFVNGKTVVHGHIPPDPDGACGLLLDGEGTVRVMSVRVTPLS